MSPCSSCRPRSGGSVDPIFSLAAGALNEAEDALGETAERLRLTVGETTTSDASADRRVRASGCHCRTCHCERRSARRTHPRLHHLDSVLKHIQRHTPDTMTRLAPFILHRAALRKTPGVHLRADVEDLILYPGPGRLRGRIRAAVTVVAAGGRSGITR